jgi:hypothetical protein
LWQFLITESPRGRFRFSGFDPEHKNTLYAGVVTGASQKTAPFAKEGLSARIQRARLELKDKWQRAGHAPVALYDYHQTSKRS